MREQRSCGVTPDLVACFATLGGPYDESLQSGSPWDFRERAEAAANAGYRGVGIIHSDLVRMRARYSLNDIAAILSDNGLVYLELEAMLDWAAEGDLRRHSDSVRSDLLRAADRLGARHVKAAGDLSGQGSIETMRTAFAELARQAQDAGTTIVIEPIAFSSIPDLATALAVIGDTVGKGGGLLIDAWHVARGRFALDDIAALGHPTLFACEIDDGAALASGDPLAETLNDRRLCGDGEFDLTGLIAAAGAAGFEGPWGVEIFSIAHRRLSLPDAARLSFEAAARQFQSMEKIR
jgi:sugar phosphate isomerase/epimerase